MSDRIDAVDVSPDPMADLAANNAEDRMEFLTLLFLGTPVWMWLVFLSLVIGLLVLDLGVLHKGGDHEIGVRESLMLSAMYITLGIAFSGFVWWQVEPGMPGATANYLTAFVVEKTLAMDNVFVIALIFTYFAIPRMYQHRVLFWGILGVIVLRGIMIAAGAALVQEYSWVLYIFGAFLIGTGIKMLVVADDGEQDIAQNPVVRFMRRHMRVSDQLHGQKFFVREPDPRTGALVPTATPLFLALVVINIADLVFAVDSVPAIFAITTDTFIVYTANIMAILGLRALYFALAAMVHRFHYLKYALALVLVFIGAKIFWNQIVGKVDPAISLGVTLTLITSGVLWSLWKTRKDEAETIAS